MTNEIIMVNVDQEITDIDSTVVDFGITDNRGRAIGARVRKFIVDSTLNPQSSRLVDQDYLGAVYTADVQVTRDGVVYGASSTYIYIRDFSIGIVESKIQAEVAKVRKRNEKKYCVA